MTSTTYRYGTELFRAGSVIFAASLNFIALGTFVAVYNIFEGYVTHRTWFLGDHLASCGYSPVCPSNLFEGNYLDAHLASVYYFPFLYIFIIVTFLSLFFCLAYNRDELLVFSVFCFVILLAGYTLFYTDSLILFFMAYEMLLIPSFFILYTFAKTRRSVEAAYLMFF